MVRAREAGVPVPEKACQADESQALPENLKRTWSALCELDRLNESPTELGNENQYLFHSEIIS